MHIRLLTALTKRPTVDLTTCRKVLAAGQHGVFNDQVVNYINGTLNSFLCPMISRTSLEQALQEIDFNDQLHHAYEIYLSALDGVLSLQQAGKESK